MFQLHTSCRILLTRRAPHFNFCLNQQSVFLTDGRTVEHDRRERPKLLFNKNGRPTHLFNGVFDDTGSGITFTIVAPIKT